MSTELYFHFSSLDKKLSELEQAQKITQIKIKMPEGTLFKLQSDDASILDSSMISKYKDVLMQCGQLKSNETPLFITKNCLGQFYEQAQGIMLKYIRSIGLDEDNSFFIRFNSKNNTLILSENENCNFNEQGRLNCDAMLFTKD